MRIALVNWTRRRVGGVEEYVSSACRELALRGHELAFWSELDVPANRDAIPLPDGVPAWCAALLGLAPSLEALRAWRPDLLYCHGLESTAVEARLLDLAPAVTFLHSYVGACISGTRTFTRPDVRPCHHRFGPACLLHYYLRGCGGRSPLTMVRLYRTQSARLRLLRRYRLVLTHSQHMGREYLRHGVKVCHPPSYTAHSDGDAFAPVGKSLGGPGEPVRLMFLGRMDLLKGGTVLISALPGVAAALGRPVHLTFVGDGPARPAWEARARKVQARHPGVTVEFAGWVARARLGDFFARHHLLAVPSLWPEPFGLVGMEAGRAGVPVAAFAVGGIPDWLTDGVNGALAPGDPPTAAGLAGAVARCLSDAEHYSALCRGARHRAETFTMTWHLTALEELLGQALSQSCHVV
jgi:glycosyltransferase involved in cell wall biosynthesis